MFRLSNFFLYDLFREKGQKRFGSNENGIQEFVRGKSAQQFFSLDNFFLFSERAFAHSHYAMYQTWPLAGNRRVASANVSSDGSVSLDMPILQSQLSSGVWGYYLNPAARSDLLDPTMQM